MVGSGSRGGLGFSDFASSRSPALGRAGTGDSNESHYVDPVLGNGALQADGRASTDRLEDLRRGVNSDRIATQSLAPRAGMIREALTSLYELFEIVRAELKEIPVVAQ